MQFVVNKLSICLYLISRIRPLRRTSNELNRNETWSYATALNILRTIPETIIGKLLYMLETKGQAQSEVTAGLHSVVENETCQHGAL